MNKLVRNLTTGLCIMALSVPTFAATTEKVQTLTLDEAVSRAINSSDKKGMYGAYKAAYEQKNKYNKDMFDPTYRTSVNQARQNNYNLEHLDEKITYDTTSTYLDVVELQKKIEADKNTIGIKEKELAQAQFKLKKGYGTQLEVKQAENDLLTAKSTLSADQSSLNNAVVDFKKLTNLDITKYALETEFTLEPVSVPADKLQSHLDKSLTEYWNILRDNVDIQELGKLDLIGSEYGDYVMYETNIKQANFNIEDAQKNLWVSVQKSYNNLDPLKNNVETLKAQKEMAATTLKATELRYNKGLVSKLDLEKQQLAGQDLDQAIFTTTKNYILTKMLIENPNIMMMSN